MPPLAAAPLADAAPADEALLARFVAGDDREALAELYRRHADLCYRVARQVAGSSSDAEDAVQAAFMRVLVAARSFDAGRGGVRSWLVGIVLNAARMKAREEARRRRREDEVGEETPQWTGADTDAEESDRARALIPLVQSECERLPERYRLPLTLRYRDGLAFAEIAGALGLPENTVRSQVKRALDRLRERLVGSGSAAEASLIAGALALAPSETAPPALLAAASRIAAQKAAVLSGAKAALVALAAAASAALALGAWALAARNAAPPPTLPAATPATALERALDEPIGVHLRHAGLGEALSALRRAAPHGADLRYACPAAVEGWSPPGATFELTGVPARTAVARIAEALALRWRADGERLLFWRELPLARRSELLAALTSDASSDPQARAAALELARSGDLDAARELVLATARLPAGRRRLARPALALLDLSYADPDVPASPAMLPDAVAPILDGETPDAPAAGRESLWAAWRGDGQVRAAMAAMVIGTGGAPDQVAMRACSELRAREAALRLMPLIGDERQGQANAVALAIGDIADPSQLPALARLLESPDETTRERAMLALSRYRSAAAEDALITRAGSCPPQDRQRILYYLGGGGDARTLPLLREALAGDWSTMPRTTRGELPAAAALVRVPGDEAAALMAKLIGDARLPPIDRDQFAARLRRRPEPVAAATLVALARTGASPAIRIAAFTALDGFRGAAGALPAALAVLVDPATDAEVRGVAGLIAGRTGDPAAVPELERRPEGSLAAWPLSASPCREAVAALVRMWRSGDPAQRRELAMPLALTHAPEAADLLLAAVAAAPDDARLTLALAASRDPRAGAALREDGAGHLGLGWLAAHGDAAAAARLARVATSGRGAETIVAALRATEAVGSGLGNEWEEAAEALAALTRAAIAVERAAAPPPAHDGLPLDGPVDPAGVTAAVGRLNAEIDADPAIAAILHGVVDAGAAARRVTALHALGRALADDPRLGLIAVRLLATVNHDAQLRGEISVLAGWANSVYPADEVLVPRP